MNFRCTIKHTLFYTKDGCSSILYSNYDIHTYDKFIQFIYLLFYIAFNSQGHITTVSLQVEETNAYSTVNHHASASNYQLSNMKPPARDLNRQPQRLEAKTLTATPPSPLKEIQDVLRTHNSKLDK